MKDLFLQIKKLSEPERKKTEKKFTRRHIIIKLLKNKGEGKLMMSARTR